MLHLRHYLERHIHARLACKIRQLAAVVEQRLIGPGLNIDRWETFEVGMQRIGQRVLAMASFAEKEGESDSSQVVRSLRLCSLRSLIYSSAKGEQRCDRVKLHRLVTRS